jgi:L-ascorbate metabolism protein UlaG (beta-lactamase superfamily)
MKITWLGHSTFLLAVDGENILIDPWLTGNPQSPEGFELPKIDTILVSHGHGDHIADVVPIAKKDGSTVACIYEINLWLTTKGIENLQPMSKGGTVEVGKIKVTMTHAMHSSGIEDDGKIIYAGEPAGFVIHLPDGRRIYFAGDTAVFSDMQLIARLYKPDLAMLPIGDRFTMGPMEAAVACGFLKAKQVIPMHYGTFPPLTGTPDAFRKELEGQDVEVLEMEPGKTIDW